MIPIIREHSLIIHPDGTKTIRDNITGVHHSYKDNRMVFIDEKKYRNIMEYRLIKPAQYMARLEASRRKIKNHLVLVGNNPDEVYYLTKKIMKLHAHYMLVKGNLIDPVYDTPGLEQEAARLEGMSREEIIETY